MNWRPIETAPKDGGYYLFLHKNGGMHTACWNSVFEDWRITQSSISRQFTHWMPLPPPQSTEPAPQSVGEGIEPWGHDLWKHLHDEHSLMLLESELQQIVRKSVPLVGDLSQVVVVKKEAFNELLAAVSDIVKPLGDETETSGNPCCSPSPAQGRRIAAALAQLNGRAGE